MPDLFEEYGALELDKLAQKPMPEPDEAPKEPEKFENTEESPKTQGLSHRARIIIGAAAAIVVAVIAAVFGFSKYQDQKAVDRCREALVGFQSRDNYHVRLESHFKGEGALNDRSEGAYWRSGDDLLRCDQAGKDTAVNLLRKDGAVYEGILSAETGSFTWFSADFTPEWLIPWVAYYDWDAESVALLSREETAGGENITLQFAGAPYETGGSIDGFTVCFTLDESGSLTSAVLTYNEESVYGTETTVLTFRIGSESPEACARAIDEVWQEASVQLGTNRLMSICEAALQNFHALESGHIFVGKQTDITSGNKLLSQDISAHEIWRCSDTCMYALTTQNGRNTGLLYRDDQWYSMASGLWGKGQISEEDPWETSWLSSFEWNEDIRFISSTPFSGETNVITVEFEAIPDVRSALSSSTNETVTVTAIFILDAKGNLLRADRSYTYYEYTVTESCEILSTNADEIYQTITDVHSDAIAQIAADTPTLNRIQAALDEFWSRTDLHVVIQTTDTDPDNGMTTVTKEEYWRNGANGLEKNFYDGSTDPSYIYLYIGDYQYSYSASTDSWSGGDVIQYTGGNRPDWGCKMSIPFLTSVDLANRVTILRSVEETEEGTAITVEFLNDFWNYWTMCFYLDPRGSLVSIEAKESFIWSLGGASESVSYYQILPTDSQETAATIDGVYQEAYAAVYDKTKLKKCETALTEFRGRMGYAIRWEISGGPSGREDVYEKWHLGGSGTYRVQTEDGQTTGILNWQDQWYALENDQWASSNAVFGDFWNIPWITDYKWDHSKVKLISCEGTDSGEVITFQVSSDTYWAVDVSTYTVTFTLDENGSLTAAVITYEQDGSTVTCSYELLSTCTEAIYQTVTGVWAETTENLPADGEEGVLPTPEL